MPAKSDQPRAATQMVGFQTRFREDTRAKLEAAAKENGRSLNSEMVARLEQSLAWDAAAGGNRNRRLFVRIHEAISEIEALTGNKWTADPVTFAAVRRAVLDELAALAPPLEDQEMVPVLSELIDAQRAVIALGRLRDSTPEGQQALRTALFGNALTVYDPPPMLGEEVDRAYQEAYGRMVELQAREEELRQRQRMTQREGRALHRHWRKLKKAQAERAAAAYGA